MDKLYIKIISLCNLTSIHILNYKKLIIFILVLIEVKEYTLTILQEEIGISY